MSIWGSEMIREWKQLTLISMLIGLSWLMAGSAPESDPAEAGKGLLHRPQTGATSRPTERTGRPKTPQLPPGARLVRDLEYARTVSKSLKLDLFLPPKDKQPVPVVVWIHGGGWRVGNKGDCPFVWLAGQGYAVVSIDYRLTHEAIFPAQIHDCKAAIRWVRAHAAEYGLDPARVGAAGISAGGHLVALLGTSGGVKELEGDLGNNLKYSSKVQAVVDFCGPAVFTGEAPLPNDVEQRRDRAVVKLLGGSLHENQEKARLASPSTFVGKDDPPILIVHGDQDEVVPVNQSIVFADMLKKAGVDVTLSIIKGAPHFVITPDTLTLALKFFDKHLKR